MKVKANFSFSVLPVSLIYVLSIEHRKSLLLIMNELKNKKNILINACTSYIYVVHLCQKPYVSTKNYVKHPSR